MTLSALQSLWMNVTGKDLSVCAMKSCNRDRSRIPLILKLLTKPERRRGEWQLSFTPQAKHSVPIQ